MARNSEHVEYGGYIAVVFQFQVRRRLLELVKNEVSCVPTAYLVCCLIALGLGFGVLKLFSANNNLIIYQLRC